MLCHRHHGVSHQVKHQFPESFRPGAHPFTSACSKCPWDQPGIVLLPAILSWWSRQTRLVSVIFDYNFFKKLFWYSQIFSKTARLQHCITNFIWKFFMRQFEHQSWCFPQFIASTVFIFWSCSIYFSTCYSISLRIHRVQKQIISPVNQLFWRTPNTCSFQLIGMELNWQMSCVLIIECYVQIFEAILNQYFWSISDIYF